MLEPFGQSDVNWVAAAQQVHLIQSLYTSNRQYALSALSPGEELIVWRVNRNTWPPSFGVVKRGNSYFLFIEGTTNNYQFTSHAWGTWARTDYLGDSSVNGAWWEATRDILGEIPSTTLGKWYMSGHSYGGACAAIIAMSLADQRGSEAVELMTFGTPRYMTNGYRGNLPSPYWRIEATTDLVPTMPPSGVELIGTVWSNPLNWLRTDWFFWDYGDEKVLNSKGEVNGAQYDPNAKGDLNVIGFPDAHYLSNYWGRLNARMNRAGNPSPDLLDAMSKAREGFNLPPGQVLGGEYAGIIAGPNGEPVRIPGLFTPPVFGGPNVPIYNVNLVFQGRNNRTWREGHAVNATTATEAASLLQNNDVIAKRTAFLSKVYKIALIEAVNLQNPRDGIVRTGGYTGSMATLKAETAGVSINMGYFLSGGYPQAWKQIRGFPDTLVRFNSDSGTEEIEASVQEQINTWIAQLKTLNFGSYVRLREVPTDPTLSRNYVTSMNGDTSPGLTVVSCANVVNLGGATHVSIHLRGAETKRALPGISGNVFPVVGSTGTQFTIPYTIPRGGVLAPGQGSYMRPARFVFAGYTGSAEFGYIFAKRTRRLK